MFIIAGGVVADELYSNDPDLVKLTQSNFDSLVLKTNDMWLIEFYGKILER